jgi:hypothetical protein
MGGARGALIGFGILLPATGSLSRFRDVWALKLCLRDFSAFTQLSTSESAQTTPEPAAGRVAGFGVVTRQRCESERSPSAAATVRSRYLYPSPALITRIETVTAASSTVR